MLMLFAAIVHKPHSENATNELAGLELDIKWCG